MFTVVGGPWVTVQEDYFGPLADVMFVGEAEETWPRFLREWQAGEHASRYEQAERTDMTRVPAPRYDMLKMRHYLFGSLQISRGCPFQCEFCDIIVTFGRRPRLKTAAQVIAEMEALLAEGMEIALIVDDNLIGNKQAIKPVLAEIAAWQRAHGYPLTFFTEASLDLAEDEELMRPMTEANITSVFVGVESPNEESLRETKKYQNVRQGRSIVERVHAIQDAGMDVWCGMILGFDHDDARHFRAAAAVFARSPRAARHDRHVGRDTQNAAARPAGGRRAVGRKRRAGVRHECDSCPDDAGRAARWLRAGAGRAVRAGGLFRAVRGFVSAGGFNFGVPRAAVLAPALVEMAEGRIADAGPIGGHLCGADAERARRSAAAGVSPLFAAAAARSGAIRKCCSCFWSNARCTITITPWPGRWRLSHWRS